MASINQIMLSASFVNCDIAPVKSSVLWFRKEQAIASRKNNRRKIALSVENGCTLPNEQEIAKLLYAAKSVS